MGLITIDGLQEGDILLMLGDGPLSDLIAWASDGPYSHAALVVDGGDLLEASFAGVRRAPLRDRVKELAHYHFIDAWRPHDAGGQPWGTADRALGRERAERMLGAPYPVDQLALFGAVMAVRGKWPKHPLLRKLVRIALDRALPSESPALVCSEVVYRAWAECDAAPRGRMALPIIEGERGDAPFPAIDWQRLYDEIGPLLFPAPEGEALRGAAPADVGALLGSADEVPDEVLDEARRRLLGATAGQARLRSAGTASAGASVAPNPRLVSPQDLANSPGTTLLGRLMQREQGGAASGAVG